MAERIIVHNCNCVRNAELEIIPNTLNIKYGSNGTGKSTLSRAIYAKASGDSDAISELKPYGADQSCVPVVEDFPFHIVRVFDESYINSYLFQGDEFFSDSFGVFLRSDDCDQLTAEIEKLLSELQGMFTSNEVLQELRAFLPVYVDAVKFADGSIQKRGGVGEFVKGNGAGFEKYSELDIYKPYYADRDMGTVSKWAKWRNDGIKQIHGTVCPFCATGMPTSIKRQNEVISKVFKNSALATASAVLEYLEKAVEKGYIDQASCSAIMTYLGNGNKEDELYTELQNLGTETMYLLKKIEKICSFRPMNVTHEQLICIEESIEDLRIDSRILLRYYNTTIVTGLVKLIDEKIDNLKNQTSILKGLFIQHEKKLEKLINERQSDINHFFSLAGFPYEFRLEKKGEKKAAAYLVPVKMAEISVRNPQRHLSWGEKNAFSLVMFMFEAISDNADLIVLDDPISSFDEHKKFAIIRRMFDNQRPSFRDKTVLMFTHDLQPLIDYIHGKFFNRYGLTTPVTGFFLQNSNGEIVEKSVVDSDLVNTVELTKQLATDSDCALPIRIVNLRKYVELTVPNYSSTEMYDVLSNIIHGRSTATDKDGNFRDTLWVENGMREILKYIDGESYNGLIEKLSNERLIEYAESDDKYLRIIAIRLLFERKENMLSKLRREYPAACKYINETNHVENDYIFQLDPRVYYSVPDVLIDQIREFMDQNRHELGA